MPTSRARKGRLVARLKKKQKHALAKKTHLGPSKSGCLIQSRSKKDANALTKIITYLRFALGRHDFSDIVSLTRNEECARKAESDRIEVENKDLNFPGATFRFRFGIRFTFAHIQ